MYYAIATGKVWHGEIKNRAKDESVYRVDRMSSRLSVPTGNRIIVHPH
jgi:hypothetical protein